MSRRITALAVVLFSFGSATEAREWARYHQELELVDEVVAQWTTVFTSDSLFPSYTRVLYEDDDANLFVIRKTMATESGPSNISIQHLGTEEVITFEMQGDSLTVTLGSSQLVVTRAEAEAFSGPSGSTFPPQKVSAAASLLSPASQSFKDALRSLAQQGCREVLAVFGTVVPYAHLFYDDVACTRPARTDPEQTGWKAGFDPNQNPPSPFEQQFDQAYYTLTTE